MEKRWKKYKYPINIHYRGQAGSRREKLVLELAREYNVEPNCHLIDRVLSDRVLIIQQRASRKAEALKKKQEAERELNELVAGNYDESD